MLSDRYAIRRELGRGGMAVVYLADDLRHDRQVAIKVLLPELAAAIGADRFEREIRTVARLQHPHILPLFDSGRDGDSLYFVMPFVDGESLRSRLEREGALPLEAVTPIVRHIGDALDHAHAQGVVHRDVKPENILLSGGQALLADFGIARAPARHADETITSIGTAVGTPAYMSPEQASGERDLDGRSDLYALGCVTYELLAGVPPFSGGNPMATIAQHVLAPPPRLAGARAPVPDLVADAVERMLAKDPTARFGTAAAFTGVLEEALSALRQPSTGERELRAIARGEAEKSSVLVLDFTNISGAAAVDWLSGGIAETVSVDLRRIGGIRVVGTDPGTRQRIAAERATGGIDADAVRRLGRSAGARWVVWGAFQHSGTRIRLTPQFSDVESGITHAVEKIDGTLDDIFELQDRIVMRFAEQLSIELTATEAAQIAKPETDRLSAYERYARGKQAFLLFGTESARAAADHFRRAIELDPGYALAWAGLGSLLMPNYIASGDQAVLAEGVEALQRAMALDPGLGEPYVFLAYMYTQQHRYDEAITAARASLERDPGAFLGWYLLGVALLARGLSQGTLDDLARAILPLLRCRAINPSYHPAQLVAGWTYMLRGQYSHAAPLVDEAVDLERAGTGLLFLGSFVERALLHAHAGEPRAARPFLDLAIATYPTTDHVYAPMMTAWATFARGRLAEAEGDLASAQRDFDGARRLADENERRLGIGAHWVSATLGLARLAFRRGDRSASDALLASAIDLASRRHRFVWVDLLTSAPAVIAYETAATHALRGDSEAAFDALAAAVRLGWADVHQLAHDPCFVHLRDTAAMRTLLARATALVVLPPPVGAGGFPDLGEPFSQKVTIDKRSIVR
ncbi:MAG TPA: protein kinase [Gemmatimonadales bacterium]